MIQRAYKFRFYPTGAQAKQLDVEFGHARFVWNWALDMRNKAYARRKESLNNISITRVLTCLKKSPRYSWLQDASYTCHTQKLRDLDAAFKKFYQGGSRYPKFKTKGGHQSIRYQIHGPSLHRDYKVGERLRITKLGELKVKWSRLPKGMPKMVTISRDAADRYFVSMSVQEPIIPLSETKNTIGIDMGIADVVVTSDGFKSGAPKYTRKYEKQLAKAQRRLSRKTKGSRRRMKQRQRVAKIHAKIKDSRSDFLHKLTRKLINENQVIGIEDLCVKGMMRSRLSKSIADTGMHELRRQLEYKADWYGRELAIIDRWEPTSKTCSCCGHKLDELSLSVRQWTCPKCKSEHDRDINAAINVLHTVRSTGINARGELLSRGA